MIRARIAAPLVLLLASLLFAAVLASVLAVRDREPRASERECLIIFDANGLPHFVWADTGEPCGEDPYGPTLPAGDSR